MSDTVKVDLEENGKYRVALELAYKIAAGEPDPPQADRREYYLRLYRQAYDTVYGYRPIDDVLKGSTPKTMAMSW